MNVKNDSKSFYEIIDMSEDEFEDYMIDEYNKKPSDSEIIKNSGKTIKNLIKEINEYHDKLTFLSYKYELSLKNKAAFILKFCKQKDHIQELMPLLSCFICKPDYLFQLKNKKVSIRREGRLAEYLLLKDDIDIFERCIKETYANAEKLKVISKKIKESGNNKNNNISPDQKKLLIKLYKRYVQIKNKNKGKVKIDYENKCLDENIEQIHNFAMETVERQQLYPIIIFIIFTRHKSSIIKEMYQINSKNLMNYHKYKAIDKDNGKNFNTYENYISLFLELIDNFDDICNVSLCMYAFEKTSNLAEWLYKHMIDNKIFHYTIDSLIESEYGSTFYEESIFLNDSNLDINNYADFEVTDEDNKNGKSQYLSELIESWISDKDTLDYLNEYAKGKRYAAKFIKKVVYKFFESNNYKLENMKEEGYVFLIFESVIQEKADTIIKEKIIKLLKNNS